MAQIGQDAQVCGAVGAAQLQRFSGIVRHGERAGFERAHVDCFHVVRHPQQAVQVWRAQGRVRAFTHPHGNAKTQRQGLGTADVIGVFVGNKEGVQLFHLQLRLCQAGLQLPDAEPAIDQEAAHLAATAAFDHRGIAGAAAAQVLESKHGGAKEWVCGNPKNQSHRPP